MEFCKTKVENCGVRVANKSLDQKKSCNAKFFDSEGPTSLSHISLSSPHSHPKIYR